MGNRTVQDSFSLITFDILQRHFKTRFSFATAGTVNRTVIFPALPFLLRLLLPVFDFPPEPTLGVQNACLFWNERRRQQPRRTSSRILANSSLFEIVCRTPLQHWHNGCLNATLRFCQGGHGCLLVLDDRFLVHPGFSQYRGLSHLTRSNIFLLLNDNNAFLRPQPS